MFKSVFFKYITAFLLINLGSFLIMTSIITSLVNGYSTNVKTNMLNNVTESFAEQIKKSVSDDPAVLSLEDYVSQNKTYLNGFIGTLSFNIYSLRVFISDCEGRLLMIGGIAEEDDPITAGNIHVGDNMDDELFNSIKEDEHSNLISDLNSKLKAKYIFSSNKILLDSGENAGFIVAFTRDTGLNNLLHTLLKTIILSSLWIMLALLIVVYFITEKLVSPIREMSRAAKEYASGRFDVRVTVRGNDEIAELGTAFNNMAASLSTNEETRRLFLANVSHDLRTPMTTISGYIDGMLDGAIPEDQRDYYLGVVASETRRLSRLVSSLLDITKIQAGERKFKMTSFDVCETCREIIIASEQRIVARRLSVSLNVDNDNMYAYADKDAVHQIIYNLVDNAIKYSTEGTEFVISVKDSDKKLLVSVFNYGEGISNEDLPHVFDRFFKADKSRGLDKSGSGLGLFISRTICEAHGETITAESEQGSWCRFTFTLEKGSNPRRKTGEDRK